MIMDLSYIHALLRSSLDECSANFEALACTQAQIGRDICTHACFIHLLMYQVKLHTRSEKATCMLSAVELISIKLSTTNLTSKSLKVFQSR